MTRPKTPEERHKADLLDLKFQVENLWSTMRELTYAIEQLKGAARQSASDINQLTCIVMESLDGIKPAPPIDV